MAHGNVTTNVPAELKSAAVDGVVASAEGIFDYNENKTQEELNQDLKKAIEDIDVTDQISGKADKSEMSVVAGTGANADKTTITLKNGTSATVLTQHQDVSGKEDKSNKVTSFSSPTDTQYPSAKLVSDQLATKQDALSDIETIRSGAAAGATAVQPATTLAGYGITDGYTKTEVNNLITTPNQEYVSVAATDQTTSVTDVLPATGAADTTYRIGNWDGTQYNDSAFSEYAWDGSAYIKLSTKSQVGEVYDISANHADTKYSDLAAALDGGANIPQSLQKGGMSVKFVRSSDNKYVQYRLASPNWSTDIHDWTSEDPYFIDKIMQEVNEAIDEHTPIEIHGDVTNAPDEEDLTSVNVGGTDVLKFKDKAYNPLTYSGMGRKILRKNIVEGVNTLTKEMMSDANTIYVIQYNFTLGEDINVPANCVLDFEGGSIANATGNSYTLTGNETIINSPFSDNNINDVELLGTFKFNIKDSEIYVIDNARWGITPGYINMNANDGYDDEDYTTMYNNARGVENAIMWASEMGYKGVKFENDIYCFTTERPKNRPYYNWPIIKLYSLSHFDIDFGGSTFCLLLDSAKYSQYYNKAQVNDPTFNQCNQLFYVSNSEYVSIHNGHFIGDRAVRKWLSVTSSGNTIYESLQEQTYGIAIGAYSRFITIKDMNLESFMGDGIMCYMSYYINGNFSPYYGSVSIPEHRAYRGKYKYVDSFSNLQIIEDTANIERCTISDLVDLSPLYASNLVGVKKKLKEERIYSLRGSNRFSPYDRFSNCYPEIDVITYNHEDTNTPIRIIKVNIFENFKLMPNEDMIRLQFYYDDDDAFVEGTNYVNKQISICEAQTYQVVIKDCYIHDNHRGGFTGDGYRILFEHNIFERSMANPLEKTGEYTYYGAPNAQVATRYHIDFEDIAARDIRIIGNIFRSYGSNAPCIVGSVVLGCVDALVSDNQFFGASLRIGDICDTNICNNLFYQCGISCLGDRYNEDGSLVFAFDKNSGCLYKKRVILISNNYIDGGDINLGLKNTILRSTNNYYNRNSFRHLYKTNAAYFTNDTIRLKEDINMTFPIHLFRNCKFIGDSLNTINISVGETKDASTVCRDNVFKNVNLSLNYLTKDFIIKDCVFDESTLRLQLLASMNVILDNIMNFKLLGSIAIMSDNATCRVTFKNIKFKEKCRLNAGSARRLHLIFDTCDFYYNKYKNQTILRGLFDVDNSEGISSVRFVNCKNLDNVSSVWRFGPRVYDESEVIRKNNPVYKKGETTNRPLGRITSISGATLPTEGKKIFNGYTFHLTAQDGDYAPGYWVASRINDSTITWINETTIKSDVPANVLRTGTVAQRLDITAEYAYNNLYNRFIFYDTTLKQYFYATVKRSGYGTEQSPYTYTLNWEKVETTTLLLTANDAGFEYFDTDLGKAVYAKVINETTGTVTWVDATGTPV